MLKLKRSETNRYKRGLPTREAQFVMQNLQFSEISNDRQEKKAIGQAEKVCKFQYELKSTGDLKIFYINLSSVVAQIMVYLWYLFSTSINALN